MMPKVIRSANAALSIGMPGVFVATITTSISSAVS